MRDTSRGIVYFISAPSTGLVKIGITASGYRYGIMKDIRAKLQLLRGYSPVPLIVLGFLETGGQDEERAWHRRWQHLRSHGEWFYLTDELDNEIKSKTKPVPDKLNVETRGTKVYLYAETPIRLRVALHT